MPRKKPTKSTPATLKRAAHAAELANQAHSNCLRAAAESVVWAVVAGLHLAEVRKRLKHGEWLPWLKENWKANKRTAQRYVAVAEGVKSKFQRDWNLKPSSLIESKNDTVSHLASLPQPELIEAIKGVTQGETLRELYVEFGIVRAKPVEKNPPGGKRGPADEDETDPTAYAQMRLGLTFHTLEEDLADPDFETNLQLIPWQSKDPDSEVDIHMLERQAANHHARIKAEIERRKKLQLVKKKNAA